MDLIWSKVVVAILFFLLTTGAAFLPWVMKVVAGGDSAQRRERVERLLTALNYVAGGVFIATILLHLIPEVHEEMTEALVQYGVKTTYPIPEFVVGAGLLLFVLIEQVVLACHEVKGKSETDGETTELTGGSEPASHRHESDSVLQTTSMIRSYALLLALSLHSIFEGMVVGFQKTPALVWELFVAIVIHKVLVAFGLGSRLLSSRHHISIYHYVGMILVFATMTPLGDVIGTILSNTPKSVTLSLVESILVGLATGSFMFVTFFEIIRFEGGHKANLVMCLLVVLGFTCIAVVMILHNEHH